MSQRTENAAIVVAATTLAMPMFIGMMTIISGLLRSSIVMAPIALLIWAGAAAYLAYRIVGPGRQGGSDT